MLRAGLLGPFILTAGLVGAQAARAQDSGLSATATVTSDYRFRGVSQSGLDPAVQGSVDYDEASSGLYAGIWGSTVRGLAGADAEVDLYAGLSRTTANGWRWGLGGYGYFYPGADHLSYGEATAELGYTLGPVQAKAIAAYAPSQANIGGDNLYLGGELNAGVPKTPLTLVLHGGSANPDSELARAVQLGINKINISSDIKVSYHNRMREVLGTDERLREPNAIQPEPIKALQATAAQKIELFGADGKAGLYR